jgi:uncharacterized protein (TIGR00297 family)
MQLLLQLAIGIVFSGAIALAAYRRGSLARSGVAGAMIVGTAIFGFGGWVWGLVLITFFVLSSLLSHYREAAKAQIAAEKFDKGSARDLGQALANGGAGALLAIAGWLLAHHPLALAAFIGAMATVNADTWATELGVLSRRPPRLITTLKRVEPGTSGGVSALGTLAAAAGGLVIGLAALVFMAVDGLIGGDGLGRVTAQAAAPERGIAALLAVAVIGGLAGSLFDSLLGATVQSIYTCPTCARDTEKKLHTCGTPTRPARGWRWLDNDLVNFIASLFGAGVAAGLWALIA